MLYEDQNAHNLKQQYDELQNEIADILLGIDSPVRGFAEFDSLMSEHDQLLSRQAELKDLETKLTEALPGLEQAEGTLTAAQKHLATEKKKLADYASELGKAAFSGLRSGELPDHQIFSDRKNLQSRLENLQHQRSELTSGENTGMIDKAKVHAQQLKVKGQIKLEELKIKPVDRALGEALLTSKEKLSVQCNQTEKVIKAISDQRKQVSTARDYVKQCVESVTDRKVAVADVLNRPDAQNSMPLKSELIEIRKRSKATQKGVESLRQAIVAMALEVTSLRENSQLDKILKQMLSLRIELDSRRSKVTKTSEDLLNKFRQLPSSAQYSVYGGIAVMLLFSAIGLLGLLTSGAGHQITISKLVDQPPSLSSQRQITEQEAIKKLKSEGHQFVEWTDGTVSFTTEQEISASDASLLKRVEKLKGITLEGKQISNVSLNHLNDLDTIHFLDLKNTGITDDGLSQLKSFDRLQSLDLSGTKITKRGLFYLKGLDLEFLNLLNTDVSTARRRIWVKTNIQGMLADISQPKSLRRPGSTSSARSTTASPGRTRNLVGNGMIRELQGLPKTSARGLERIGCTREECLICASRRSQESVRAHSDRRGFGLCSTCGLMYSKYERLAPKFRNPQSLTIREQRAVKEFLSRLQFYTQQTAQGLKSADPRGQAAALMGFFVAGKFASHEWDTLVGGE